MHPEHGQITYRQAPLSQETLELFFRQDARLLDTFHIAAPASATVCAARTYADLEGAPGLSFYLLCQGAENIGYFGLQRLEDGTRALTGFYLLPAFRRRNVVLRLWDIITNEFDGLPFFCGVYAKNEAAVAFLEKKSPAYTTLETKDGTVKLFTINGTEKN